jgi:hypothetical protein
MSSTGDSGPASGGASDGDALRPARWFHLEDRERRGPVELAVVRELVLEGSLGPDDYVWADGMDDWRHVRDVPALVPPGALRVTLSTWPDDPRTSGTPDASGAPA